MLWEYLFNVFLLYADFYLLHDLSIEWQSLFILQGRSGHFICEKNHIFWYMVIHLSHKSINFSLLLPFFLEYFPRTILSLHPCHFINFPSQTKHISYIVKNNCIEFLYFRYNIYICCSLRSVDKYDKMYTNQKLGWVKEIIWW